MRFGLSSETRILEMCNWDEDRTSHVIDTLSSAIESSIDSCSHLSKNDMLSSITDMLSESLEDYEVEVLVDILEESIKNFNFIIDTNTEYEN